MSEFLHTRVAAVMLGLGTACAWPAAAQTSLYSQVVVAAAHTDSAGNTFTDDNLLEGQGAAPFGRLGALPPSPCATRRLTGT